MLTDTELAVEEAERERQLREQEQQKRLKLVEKLRSLSLPQLEGLGINLQELE